MTLEVIARLDEISGASHVEVACLIQTITRVDWRKSMILLLSYYHGVVQFAQNFLHGSARGSNRQMMTID